MDVKLAVEQRRSIRAFTDQPVPDEVVREMLDAARLAPSGCNAQPWRFYVVRGPEMTGKLKAHNAFRQDFVYKAPLIIICCGNPAAYQGKHGGEGQVAEGSVPADQEERKKMFSLVEGKEVYRTIRDVSIASAFMVLRATELGLGTCYVGLVDEPAIRQVLDIAPEQVIPFVVIAGYAAQHPKQRPRKTLPEIMA
jgi:nitroreductase